MDRNIETGGSHSQNPYQVPNGKESVNPKDTFSSHRRA